jgi:signal transduction histidine kinase
VVLTVIPAMVLAVGLLVAVVGWREHVAAARAMAEARLDDAWRSVDGDLTERFGCSDALLSQVECASCRLVGSDQPIDWFRALAPLFAGKAELSYASFSLPDGRFFGVYQEEGVLGVNFNAQDGGGHRRRWVVAKGVATLVDDTPGFPYDPRLRPFWRTALDAGGAAWTRPYRFVGPVQRVGLTRTRAVYAADHSLVGVSTVDWTIAALSTSIAEEGLGIADRLLLTTEQGEVLVVCGAPLPPSRQRDAPVEHVQDLGDPLSTALVEASVPPGAGLFEIADPSDGECYLATRRPIRAGQGWSLALAAKRDPLLAPARHHLLVTGEVIGLTLPLALLMAWTYARHVVRANTAASRARDAALAAEAEAQRLRIERERERLEQLSALGLLAGGIAHDLRNSIGCVIGISGMLRSGALEQTQVRSYADILSRSGEQANQLCEDLLRFARKGSAKSEDYDAHDAVRTAVNIFATTGRSVTVDLSGLAAERHRVHGNRNLLQAAVLNMCLNARDAMAGQGVIAVASTVRLVTAAEAVADPTRALTPGPHLHLSVADNGEGMDTETLKRCLEPLFTTKGEQGTGLGLASVRRAAREHGGTLEIESVRGRGTCVSLLLPLAGERAAAASDDVARS